MSVRDWLILLTAGGALTGLAAGACALVAAFAKSKPDPIVSQLQIGWRPDDTAGDASIAASKAGDLARMLEDEARFAAPLNRAASILTIASVILTSVAGLVGALAL